MCKIRIYSKINCNNELILVFFLVAVAVLACAGTKNIGDLKSWIDNRIVQGETVQIEDVPYQVLLYGIFQNGTRRCGGVIISPQVILTAAHCVSDLKALQIKIRVGSSNRYKGGIIETVAEVIVHKRFTRHNPKNDIGLLIISGNLTFSNEIQAAKLPEHDIQANEVATISGWGQTEASKLPKFLQKGEIIVIDKNKCKSEVPLFDSRVMLCALSVNLSMAQVCSGDSGGPLTKDGIVYGITSWKYKGRCAHGYSFFTRVFAFRKWISSKVNL